MHINPSGGEVLPGLFQLLIDLLQWELAAEWNVGALCHTHCVYRSWKIRLWRRCYVWTCGRDWHCGCLFGLAGCVVSDRRERGWWGVCWNIGFWIESGIVFWLIRQNWAFAELCRQGFKGKCSEVVDCILIGSQPIEQFLDWRSSLRRCLAHVCYHLH